MQSNTFGRVSGDKINKQIAIFLVLGETGAGKTTLINSFANHFYRVSYEQEKQILIPFKKGQECYFEKHEQNYDINEVDGKVGASKTQNYHIYDLENDHRKMIIIDTPGIGDPRGPEQDEKNVKQIIEGVKKLGHIQGILFVINPRTIINRPLKYCIDEIRKIMTSSFLDRFIIVCTKTSGEINKNVKDAYDEVFGPESSRLKWFTMDNSAFSETIQAVDLRKKAHHERMRAAEWDMSSETFEEIYEMVSQMEPRQTQEMETLFLNRKDLEKRIRKRVKNLEATRVLEEEINQLDDSYEEISKNKFRFEKAESRAHVRTKRSNFNCSICKKTCDDNASLAGYVLGSILSLSIYHWIFSRSDCRECRHSNKDHIYEQKKFVGIGKIAQRILAKLEEKVKKQDQAKLTKKVALEMLEKSRQKKLVKIAKLMEEIKILGIIDATYDSFVENLEYLIESSEKEPCQTQMDKLRIEGLKADLETYKKIRDALNNI